MNLKFIPQTGVDTMSKLRLTREEKEMCGLTPAAVEAQSEDELGAKSALPRNGFVPIEEISTEQVLKYRPFYLRG